MQTTLSKYVKAMRKQHRLTQSQSDSQPVRGRDRSGTDDKNG